MNALEFGVVIMRNLKLLRKLEEWLEWQLDITPKKFDPDISESAFNWNKGYRKAIRDTLSYLKQKKKEIGQDS